MSAPDEVVERAEQYGRELDEPAAETLERLEELLGDHVPDPWMGGTVCTCGVDFPRSYAAHVVQELAAAGLLVALADDDHRPADARPPRPARRFGSFAVSGGSRRLADEEGGS